MVKAFKNFISKLFKSPNIETVFTVGGHRGSGNTDRPSDIQYQIVRGAIKPSENTIPSILQAFQNGASFVEIDVVYTKDHQIVATHSDDLRNHVLHDFEGPNFVSERSLESLSALKVGPLQNGKIPSLLEVLETIKNLQTYQTSDFCLNIELKDVKDTELQSPKNIDFFYKGIADTIEQNGFDLSKIVFSSFALNDLIELRKAMPDARLGMLYMPDDWPIENIYPNQNIPDSQTMHFTPKSIKEAWKKAQIEFVHPELLDRNEDGYAQSAALGLSVNFWMMEDAVQNGNETAIQEAAAIVQKHGISQTGFIADEVSDTHYLKQNL